MLSNPTTAKLPNEPTSKPILFKRWEVVEAAKYVTEDTAPTSIPLLNELATIFFKSTFFIPTRDNSIIVDIAKPLKNPIAAENTLIKIETAILERLESPEAFAIWQSSKNRKYPYRRINVSNYSVWYVVIDNEMEIRRILYSRRNEETLLK